MFIFIFHGIDNNLNNLHKRGSNDFNVLNATTEKYEKHNPPTNIFPIPTLG